MQFILREKLMQQAEKLTSVSNLYKEQDYLFVDAYFSWLESAENDLSKLRSPLTILLQAEKTMLNSTRDGYLPEHVQAGRNSSKIQRASAAMSLNRVSKAIYENIETIDQDMKPLNESLCQAVAVLAQISPEIFQKISVDQSSSQLIWMSLGKKNETSHIFNYLSTRIDSIDRDYLMLEILQKFAGNTDSAS